MTDFRSSPVSGLLRRALADAIDSPTVAALADVFNPRNTQSALSKSYSEQIVDILLPRMIGHAQSPVLKPVAYRWRFEDKKAWNYSKNSPLWANDRDIICEPLFTSPDTSTDRACK